MAFTSLNGNALFGTVYPIIKSAVFSSPTTLGQIVISSIVGNFTSYTITRNGGAESASQTATTYTDTGIANNAQCTYTIVPYIGRVRGKVFTAITNPNNAGTPGQIYTLASPSSLALTYVGASSTTTSVYFTWTNSGYSSIRLQNTTISGTVATYTSASATILYNSSGKDTLPAVNGSYTYTATVVNGDGYYVNGAPCQATLATCTWASAPTLTYNGAGCSATQISFTFSGGTYTNLSVQYPSGTEITKTTTSPYTGGAFTANQQVTYYVYPINALAYTSSNGSTVSVCTLATCSAPTFSSTTSAGTTLACAGIFSKVYITYSGGTATPASGTTVTGANSITQAYTPMTAATYTFNCYPVNALNYQSTTVASANVTIPSSGPTPIIQYAFNSSNVSGSRLLNKATGVYDLNMGTTVMTVIGGKNCLSTGSTTTSYAVVDTAVTNNSSTLITGSTSYTAITIIFWYYRVTSTDAWHAIWEWYNSSQASKQLYIQTTGDGVSVNFWQAWNGAEPRIGLSTLNTWEMYTSILRDAGSFQGYKDSATTTNSESTTFTSGILNATRSSFTFLRSMAYGDTGLLGYIADFRIYASELTTAQISAIYSAGIANS